MRVDALLAQNDYGDDKQQIEDKIGRDDVLEQLGIDITIADGAGCRPGKGS